MNIFLVNGPAEAAVATYAGGPTLIFPCYNMCTQILPGWLSALKGLGHLQDSWIGFNPGSRKWTLTG